MPGKTVSFVLRAMLLAFLIAGCTPAQEAPPSLAPLSPAGTVTAPPLDETPNASSDVVEIDVYFTDSQRFAAGNAPFETAVKRRAPADQPLPEAVLEAFFAGPTPEEQARGLEAVTSGFTGLRALNIVNGVAHVYLTGECASGGGAYTVAQPVMKNLLQFEEVQYVKIYDAQGQTGQPYEPGSSIPFCLEP